MEPNLQVCHFKLRRGEAMRTTTPKLPLQAEERARLRANKIKLKDIVRMNVSELAEYLQCSDKRARKLIGLAQFQTIPSIGPVVAQGLVDLEYYALQEVIGETGANLTDRLEALRGYWMDPCVEDCLRCVVHHANYPESDRSWWHFTAERKQYREQFGYPASRPTLAWHQVK